MVLLFGGLAAAPAIAQVPPPAVIEVAPGAPPPLQMEVVPPPPPGPRAMVWVQGRWRWDGRAWAWVPGHYVERPLGRARWVPGHWAAGPRGWRWIEGHWR